MKSENEIKERLERYKKRCKELIDQGRIAGITYYNRMIKELIWVLEEDQGKENET